MPMKAILSLFAASGERRMIRLGPGIMRLAASLFLVVLVCAPMAALAQAPAATAGQNQAIDSEAFRIKAYSQYDLARLYLKSGEVEKAVAAARQIIQSRIPPEYEAAVVESMSKIAGMLQDVRRFDLAQSLLDETLKVTVQNPNRVKIWQTKAALYFLAGDNDKAIEAARRAKDLEARGRF